tara:strand:+ start:1329 stop:1592 length:264 start_codon:yes stop_codon:yes gene_type:complete
MNAFVKLNGKRFKHTTDKTRGMETMCGKLDNLSKSIKNQIGIKVDNKIANDISIYFSLTESEEKKNAEEKTIKTMLDITDCNSKPLL